MEIEEKKIEFLKVQLDMLKKSREIREYITLWKQAYINRIGEISPGSDIENG